MHQALWQARAAKAQSAQSAGDGRIVKTGLSEQLHHHGRGAVKLRDALFLDQRQRLLRIPAPHKHQTPAVAQRGQKLRMQTADVKQRHGRERGRGQAARHHGRDDVGRGHGRHGANEVNIEQRLAQRPVAGQNTLGLAAGARGKQNQRRVAGVERGRRKWRGTSGDGVLPCAAGLPLRIIDTQAGQLQGGQVVLHMGQAVVVGDQQARLQRLQTEKQLLSQAKAV